MVVLKIWAFFTFFIYLSVMGRHNLPPPSKLKLRIRVHFLVEVWIRIQIISSPDQKHQLKNLCCKNFFLLRRSWFVTNLVLGRQHCVYNAQSAFGRWKFRSTFYFTSSEQPSTYIATNIINRNLSQIWKFKMKKTLVGETLSYIWVIPP